MHKGTVSLNVLYVSSIPTYLSVHDAYLQPTAQLSGTKCAVTAPRPLISVRTSRSPSEAASRRLELGFGG